MRLPAVVPDGRQRWWGRGGEYLLQHLRAEPRQHLHAELGEVVHNPGPLAVADQAEDAAQARHADLPVCGDQHVARLHAPAGHTSETANTHTNTPQTCVSPVHVSHVVDVLKSFQHPKENISNCQLAHSVGEVRAD